MVARRARGRPGGHPRLLLVPPLPFVVLGAVARGVWYARSRLVGRVGVRGPPGAAAVGRRPRGGRGRWRPVVWVSLRRGSVLGGRARRQRCRAEPQRRPRVAAQQLPPRWHKDGESRMGGDATKTQVGSQSPWGHAGFVDARRGAPSETLARPPRQPGAGAAVWPGRPGGVAPPNEERCASALCSYGTSGGVSVLGTAKEAPLGETGRGRRGARAGHHRGPRWRQGGRPPLTWPVQRAQGCASPPPTGPSSSGVAVRGHSPRLARAYGTRLGPRSPWGRRRGDTVATTPR